jgi:hypothetical protein
LRFKSVPTQMRHNMPKSHSVFLTAELNEIN